MRIGTDHGVKVTLSVLFFVLAMVTVSAFALTGLELL